MTVALDHTIVHAKDNLASAQFLARILGLPAPEGPGHFTPVVTHNSVALDFMTVSHVSPQHYAFTVGSAEFDAAYERVRAQGVTIYAWPDRSGEGEMNHRGGQRGFYFDDPDRNLMELIEHPEDTMAPVEELIRSWIEAERNSDITTLDRLLTADFSGVGPLGYTLDRAQWLARYEGGLRMDTFDYIDYAVRVYRDAAVVIGTQVQTGSHQGNDVSGRFRVTLFATRDASSLLLAGCQISFMPPNQAGDIAAIGAQQ